MGLITSPHLNPPPPPPPPPDHHPPLFAQQFASLTWKALICSFHVRWLRAALSPTSNILYVCVQLIYNYIVLISAKSIWNQNFNGVYTCIFAEVRTPCILGHPPVGLGGPSLTTSASCWSTWPVMLEQRPGGNAWRVGVMHRGRPEAAKALFIIYCFR